MGANGSIRTRRVGFERTRQLFRFLGELEELRHDDRAARAHLVSGIVRLIPAQFVIIGDIVRAPREELALETIADHGEVTVAERARVYEFYLRRGLLGDPLAHAVISTPTKKNDVLTARPRDVLAARTWRESEFFNEARRPNGADDAIYSQRTLANDRREAIGLNRARGDRAFSREDVDLMNLAHLGLAKVLDRFAAREPGPALSPRERETLGGLLRGLSDKEISEELGIGRNTVNKYVMRIFRAHGVTTRARLMSQLLGKRSTAR